MKRILKIIGIALGVVFLGIQVVRPNRDNPVIDSSTSLFANATVPPDVATLIRNACFDCHSDETRWPFYSNIAPVSWLVASDVEQGRKHMNFSEWGTYAAKKRALKLDRLQDQVTVGSMPLPKYLLMHPDARLSDADRKKIADWAEKEGQKYGDDASAGQ